MGVGRDEAGYAPGTTVVAAVTVAVVVACVIISVVSNELFAVSPKGKTQEITYWGKYCSCGDGNTST
jgi:hypothetical protein